MDLEQDFYKSLLDNLYDGVYFVDTDRRITYWNRGAERLTGYDSEEVLGCYCRENILEHVDDKGVKLCETSLCPAVKTLRDGRAREEEVYLHHKKGHRLPVAIRVAPILSPDGKVVGTVEVFSDNTPRVISKQTIEELQRIALLDPLTEVGNRRYAEMNLKFRLAEQDRYGWPFGILFIDIDNFKAVNDRFGHEVGDDVLRMTARTLVGSLRSFDLVSRWGGEEFLALVINVDTGSLLGVADKLRKMMEQSSITYGSQTLSITISIGGTLALNSDSVESIVRRADDLMYRSKAEGRNRTTLG
ncbi:MAG: diguanylate cyclase [Actinobacteria bacterium]|jgi:diguanylate cyclase (GGDEF)-like protein/PAS domain S-box-containing protein|nr:MAG: diguanylate cyclase [Actinomycetota bacterium]